MLSLLISLLACSAEDKWIPHGGYSNSPNNQNLESSTEPSTENIAVDFELGDPISTVSTFPIQERGHNNGGSNVLYEWTDVAVYDSKYAVQVGVSGASIVDRSSGDILYSVPYMNRAYRVDSDGETIIIGSRTDQVSFWQLSTPPQMSLIHTIEPDGTHEDVAVDNGIIAIAWRDAGVKLYQKTGEELATIPANDAFAVDICENTLVYSDKEELVIVDISEPSNPQEVDRLALPYEGRDLAFNGSRIAVGLGGNGVVTFSLEEENFIEQDDFIFDGTALSVALDGDYLWTATWSSVWLTWLGGSRAVHLGQETPYFSAMGLDAEGGKAIVADWYNSTVMLRNEDFWGPEVFLPKEQFFSSEGEDTQIISIPNYSSQELTVNFIPPEGFSMTETSLTIEAGKTEYSRITAPSSSWNQMMLEWTSNDPDELSGSITLKAATDGTGSHHEDFELPLISAEGILGNARLSDYQGKVLFLAWWSDY